LTFQFVELIVATVLDFVGQAVAIVEVVADFSRRPIHQHHLLVVAVAVAAVKLLLQTDFVVVLHGIIYIVKCQISNRIFLCGFKIKSYLLLH
jgi:hypothetical protein